MAATAHARSSWRALSTGRTPIQVDRNPGGLRARPVPSEMRVVRRWSASQGYAHRTTSPASRGCASARCSTAAARASLLSRSGIGPGANVALSCAGRSAQSSSPCWNVSAMRGEHVRRLTQRAGGVRCAAHPIEAQRIMVPPLFPIVPAEPTRFPTHPGASEALSASWMAFCGFRRSPPHLSSLSSMHLPPLVLRLPRLARAVTRSTADG